MSDSFKVNVSQCSLVSEPVFIVCLAEVKLMEFFGIGHLLIANHLGLGLGLVYRDLQQTVVADAVTNEGVDQADQARVVI